MIYRFFLTIFYAVFLFLSFTPAHAGQPLTLASLDWEPYIGQNMKNQGYVAELTIEAFRRGGYDASIQYMPWARVVAMAQKGKFDGYFPEYYAESLKENFLVSEALPGGPLGFYKRKIDNITYSEIKDLKPYRIGVVRGYVNTAEFDAAMYLKKDEAKDDLTNLKKLLAKRVDLVVMDKFVGSYLMSQNMPGRMDEIEFVTPPLEVKNLHVCISKIVPQAQKKLNAFNEGIRSMTQDGTMEKIMQSHGF